MPDFLGKLKILAFTSDKFEMGGPPVGIYIAMFNPESFSIATRLNNERTVKPGGTGTEIRFRNIEARSYSFEFLVDGTGATGEKREVFADVELFKYTVGYVGILHRPHYLILNWGLFLAKCVLDSMTVTYDLFRKDGTPLRARITATFLEYIENLLEELLSDRSSPDLTHERIVKEGDTLPLLTHQIYGDSSYYPEVARVNRLNNFRSLKAGDRIIFPPIDKKSKK
jgi:hypothetical protein